MTAVILVIGTFPTQTAACHVTVTLWVPSVHSVNLRGASVSANLESVACDVTHAVEACLV